MTRKPVAVSTVLVADPMLDDKNTVITTVVCDDGSVWIHYAGETQWYDLPAIPQDEAFP